ncbi:MAG: hypothetical protein IVW54_07905 [Candidatus Binataceae bacterium]|nr:hypothetical protein [Candidatus Binataceae bacterium]
MAQGAISAATIAIFINPDFPTSTGVAEASGFITEFCDAASIVADAASIVADRRCLGVRRRVTEVFDRLAFLSATPASANDFVFLALFGFVFSEIDRSLTLLLVFLTSGEDFS